MPYKYYLSLFVLIATLTMGLLSCHSTKPILEADTEYAKIRSVMKAQEMAWSTGDIHGFMNGYWKSDQLSFIGSKGVTRGWQQTLDNYIRSYPDKESMGTLHFDILEFDLLSPVSCYVIGKYTLTRTNDQPTGYFNLIFKKIDGLWVICSDHTSG